MNILANSINIFGDQDIVRCLQLKFDSLEVQGLRKALAKNIDILDQMSNDRSKSSKGELGLRVTHKDPNYQSLMPDFKLSSLFSRKRGISHDDEVIGAKSKQMLLSQFPQ